MLLDLGLPRLRPWLRERVGPNADVAQVTTDGSLIHLDGVRLPIGPRGELRLERATAAITSARGAGRGGLLQEIRLHAFRGVVRFADADGEATNTFSADVVFAATPVLDEAVWVSGELTIANAKWSVGARDDAPPHAPMEGRAKLLLTSTGWSLEDGELASAEARVCFAGRGATGAADVAAPSDEGAGGALEAATLDLRGARVGPFVEALQAMMGRPLALPPGVPLDARLEGDLTGSTAVGGRCKLHVTAEGLDARHEGAAGADGRGLSARLEGTIAPAVPDAEGRGRSRAAPAR